MQKEAHKPDQTDQRSPGTDHLTSGPTRQCTKERRWPKPPKWGRPNPWFGRTWTDAGPGVLWREDHSDPPEGGYERFHVYLGGNRPQGAIKGASHTTHHTNRQLYLPINTPKPPSKGGSCRRAAEKIQGSNPEGHAKKEHPEIHSS